MTTFDLIYPEHSSIPFKTMLFPDGQPHVKIDVLQTEKIDRKEPMRILKRLNNPNDLLMALLVKNTLDYLDFASVELHVSYLMTARMDRVMLDGEPFSLKVVAAILNQARFSKIRIFDPHSEVTTALIERSYAVTNHLFVQHALEDYACEHSGEAPCLVSSDAGGTFAGTAKMLKEKGAEKVHLIVSHGIFSKGSAIEFIDEIYTTDSYRKVEGVRCLPVGDYL